MKALRNYLMVLWACLIAVACTNNEYQTVIPKDAGFVASLNFKTLLKDVDIPEESMKTLKSLLGMMFSGHDRDKVEEFIDGETSFGIDLSAPLYLFNSPDCPLGISMKIASEDDFDNLIDLLIRQNLCEKAKEKDGIKWSSFLKDFKIAYNDNTLLICANGSEKNMKRLFDTDEKNSFVATPNYERMSANNSPLSLFANLAFIEDDNLEAFKSILPAGVRFDDTNLFTEVILEKGHADLNAELFSNKENIQKLLEDADKNFQKINGDFIKAPENFFVWFGMGVKGEDLLNKLKAYGDLNGMLMFMDRAIDIPKIIKAIDGDLAVVVPELPMDGQPKVVLAAKTQNTDFLKDVDYWQEQMKDWNFRMVENDKNDYTLFLDGEEGVNWGVDDKNVYFSSQDASFKRTFANTNTMLDEQAKDIKNAVLYLCVNLNPVYDNLKSYLSQEGMRPVSEMFSDKNYPFDKLVFKMNNSRSCTLSCSMKDKDKTVLNALFDFFSEIQDKMLRLQ